ncbi:hypothetical protein P9112_001616 [Eukaryota sp. TZLM1-RC]
MSLHPVYQLIEKVSSEKKYKRVCAKCLYCSRALKGSARRFTTHFVAENRSCYALCKNLSTIPLDLLNVVRAREGYPSLPLSTEETSNIPVLKQPRIEDTTKDFNSEDFKRRADNLLIKWVCASGISLHAVSSPEFSTFTDFISSARYNAPSDGYLESHIAPKDRQPAVQEQSSNKSVTS